jgi:hypothetical protein
LIFVNGGWEHIDQSHTKEQSSWEAVYYT